MNFPFSENLLELTLIFKVMLFLNQIIFLIFTLGPINLDGTLSSKAVNMLVFQIAPE